METIINTLAMSDRTAVASCLLGLSSQVVLGGVRERVEGTTVAGFGGNAVIGANGGNGVNLRPTKAPAAAVASAPAYAAAFVANGAGVIRQTNSAQSFGIAQRSTKKTQHQITSMWAHRGHEPWRDPA